MQHNFFFSVAKNKTITSREKKTLEQKKTIVSTGSRYECDMSDMDKIVREILVTNEIGKSQKKIRCFFIDFYLIQKKMKIQFFFHAVIKR